MRKSLLAACLLSLTLPVGVAVAGHNGYDSRGYNGDSGYNGSYDDDRYGGDYDDSSYRSYLRYLRECRKHRRLHRDLRTEHREAHDEGFDDYRDHSDEHDAVGDVHDQYHRNRPVADACPTYRQYRRGGYDRGRYGRRDYRYGDD